MKRKIIILFSILLLVVSMFIIACDGKDCSGDKKDSEIELVLNKTNLTIVLGEKETVTASCSEEIENYFFTWKSENEAVANVTDGIVYGVGIGETTVIVTYGDGENKIEKTVNVEVSAMNISASLNFDNNKEDEIWIVCINDEFLLTPYVFFNGNKFYDEITIGSTSADESVIKTENCKIKALATGETEVTFNASWRGLSYGSEYPQLSKTIKIKVISEVQILLNQESVQDKTLYTVSNFENVSYETQMDFNVEIKVNGVVSSTLPTIEIEDEGIATIENEKIIAKNYGTTKITITWQENGLMLAKSFNVNVTYPQVNDEVLYNISNGEIITENEYLNKKTISKVYRLGDSNNVYSLGKITGLESKTERKTGNPINTPLAIKFTDGTMVLFENVIPCANVFDNENKNDIVKTFAKNDGKKHSGYYVLNDDIKDISFSNTRTTAGTFNGVFDGRGHTINGISVNGLGLFGWYDDGATVKNVAFVNVDFGNTDIVYNNAKYLLFFQPAKNGVTNVRLENVYVEVKEVSKNCFATTASSYFAVVADTLSKNDAYQQQAAGWSINNVIIDVSLEEGSLYKTSFVGGFALFGTQFINKQIANAYTITNINTNDVVNVFAQPSSATEIKGYVNRQEMLLANNDYSSFDNGLWIVEPESIPKWKTYDSANSEVTIKDSRNNPVEEQDVIFIHGHDNYYTLGLTTNGYPLSNVTVTLPLGCVDVEVNGNVISTGNITSEKIIPVKITSGNVSKTINVRVLPYEIDDVVIEIDASKGAFNLPSTYSSKSIEKITFRNAEYTNGIVPNLPVIIEADRSDVKSVEFLVDFNDGTKVLFINVKPYTRIFTQESKEEMVNTFTARGSVNDGYYILGGNVSGISFYNDWKGTSDGRAMDCSIFSGVFDGRGYTIDDVKGGTYSNKKVFGGGLFGWLGDGATIKNVAFTNVEFTDVPDYTGSQYLLFYRAKTAGITARLENVYISCKEVTCLGTSNNDYLGICYALSKSEEITWTINNVIVDMPLVEGGTYGNWATSFTSNAESTNAFRESSISNVYVISPIRVIYNSNVANVAKDNIIGYADLQAMKSANNDYTDFDNEYWKVETGGIPKWNTPAK